MEKNHFDLTKRDIGELVIKKINDFECKIQDQKGDVFNGFILAITKKDEDKRICDISFQKSTNDNKFPVRLSFRKIDRNNFDKEIKYASDKPSNIEQFTNMNLNNTIVKVDVNLYNLLLFIFLGIIIITLIHQITILVKE